MSAGAIYDSNRVIQDIYVPEAHEFSRTTTQWNTSGIHGCLSPNTQPAAVTRPHSSHELCRDQAACNVSWPHFGLRAESGIRIYAVQVWGLKQARLVPEIVYTQAKQIRPKGLRWSEFQKPCMFSSKARWECKCSAICTCYVTNWLQWTSEVQVWICAARDP